MLPNERFLTIIRFMSIKSDSRRDRNLSATEASRSFSRLLDEVEAGRRFHIHRRGREVCVMTPPTVSGRVASECLALVRTRSPVLLDDRFGEDLMDVLAGESVEEPPTWES